MNDLELKADSDSQACIACGKKIAPPAKGSLTNWLFRPTRCQCVVPLVGSSPYTILEEISAAASSTKLTVPAAPEEVHLSSRYLVLEAIGQGGMGTVYKVKDKESGLTLAAKILHKHFIGDAQAIKRFEHEARATQSLDHRNIIKVHDFGSAADGRPFLIMDLSSGESVQSLINRQGRLDSTMANKIFAQVCEALEYIHGREMLHRDLKPSNIIVENIESADMLVKLVDFGIAKIISNDDSRATETLTRTSEIIGSPPYMSPEQCLGQRLSSRSDIYSLGCVMYHTLSGKLPFEGENPVHVIVKHLQGVAPDYSTLGVDCPREYTRVIANCLYKNPIDRYQTAAELKLDLLRIQKRKTAYTETANAHAAIEFV